MLLALADGESLHGYAIMQVLSQMTGGRETILPGDGRRSAGSAPRVGG